jgi:HPt (histidine-containing phosphotransfer) domain-containing protein
LRHTRGARDGADRPSAQFPASFPVVGSGCTASPPRDKVGEGIEGEGDDATREAGRPDSDVHALEPEALRALSELFGGDQALAELASAFLDEAPERLAELRLGVGPGDVALAGRAAHTLKSNGQTFGAVELASLRRRLEVAASEGELAANRGLIDRVDVQWAWVSQGLAALREGAQP